MHHFVVVSTCALAGILLAAGSATADPPKNSPEWLANQLGDTSGKPILNGARPATSNAVPKNKVPTLDEYDEGIDMKSLKKDIWLSMEKGQYDEALKQVDALMAKKDEISFAKTPIAYVSLQMERVTSLIGLKRPIEGMVELQRVRHNLAKSGFQSDTQISNLKVHLLNQMLQLSWNQLFGVSETATLAELKKGYKRLLMVLHPDKNMQLDEEGRAYIEELRKKITLYYEQCVQYFEQLNAS